MSDLFTSVQPLRYRATSFFVTTFARRSCSRCERTAPVRIDERARWSGVLIAHRRMRETSVYRYRKDLVRALYTPPFLLCALYFGRGASAYSYTHIGKHFTGTHRELSRRHTKQLGRACESAAACLEEAGRCAHRGESACVRFALL